MAISLNRHGDVCGDASHQESQVRGLISRLLLERADEAQRGGGGGGDGCCGAAAAAKGDDDEGSDFE